MIFLLGRVRVLLDQIHNTVSSVAQRIALHESFPQTWKPVITLKEIGGIVASRS